MPTGVKIEDISSSISSVLKDYDREIWACVEIVKNWKSVGGKTKPKNISLKGGVLKMSFYDSALRNYITINEQKIIQKINKDILKEDLIKKIEVYGVQVPIYKRFSYKMNKR